MKNQYQIIDTPGLLDRPLTSRNDIELQAIAALTHLADVIVFITDPSETCGYLFKDQLSLLNQIQDVFKDKKFIIVENKVDLKQSDSKNKKISCKTQNGIDELINEIFSKIES
jgi:nucleolar GTP-binding protein